MTRCQHCKYFFLALLPICLYSSDFSPYSGIYVQNKFFYEHYLSTDYELTDLGRLHLLGLRYLIDMRLEDQNAIYDDSCELYDTYFGDQYLTDEFHRKYVPHNE
jgi:hypothetical protein